MMQPQSGSDLLDFITSAQGGAGAEPNTIQRALQVIRTHLGMEVAYVSEFVDDTSVFHHVDAPGFEALIKPGDSMPLDDIYCRHILEGRLPELIADTANEPIAKALPITAAVPIGTHISVPIRLPDGSAYGMFCCLGREANNSLNERDLQMMRAFAELAAFEISREVASKKEIQQKLSRIKDVIVAERISIVYQPIWHVARRIPLGLECLARFSAEPRRTPDLWFREAADAGLGVELELAAMRMAFSAFASLPNEAYLAVNASPETILSHEFLDVLAPLPLDRVVIEVTEHAHVADYDGLLAVLQPLRQGGVRLAVDDAGAGYSSLQHILHLRPDIIKLDMGLTRHIDLDPARRALASALIMFARDTGSKLIAEGVETASELNTLKMLGVEQAQGYFLGRPAPLASAVQLFNGEAQRGGLVA
jgi:EAL domain-containing protein (putative c-di-GMP-specific phosphodiesterase class I)